MELAYLDENFELLGYFNYINLQWNRRYYEPGDFMVQIASSEQNNNAKYIYNKHRPELGMIEKTEFSKSSSGDLILVSGHFFEFKLNDKITYPRFKYSGNIELVARKIVSAYKADIPLLELGQANNPILGANVTKQSTGDGLASVLYQLLKTQQMSYRCIYDFTNKKIRFSVYCGLDRTQSQSQNSFASFSEKLKNIQNSKVTKDNSAYKNYAYVVGNGSFEEGKQIIVEVDLRNPGEVYKRVVYVNKTSEMYEESEDLQLYKARLKQMGTEELLKNYTDILNVSFDAIQTSGLQYIKDYDLGDKCDLLIDDLEIAYTARLIEVKEVIKNSVHTIKLQFGDKIPVAYRK